MRRSATERMVGGVAGGIGARFGLEPNVVRAVFLVLTIGGGTGFALYVLAWLLVPLSGDGESIGRRALKDHIALPLALSLATAAVGVLVVAGALGVAPAAGLIWPVPIGVAGLVLIWKGAEGEERAFLLGLVQQAAPTEVVSRRRRTTALRIVAGSIMLFAGIIGVLVTRRPTFGTVAALDGAAGVAIAGLLVLFGPWWLRLARDLAVERRERVRSQERADMAAALHDSVLQTLALIQRDAADPREVTRLARAQERDLRAWLFDGVTPGGFDESEISSVAQAVTAIEREVEDNHRVAVETVLVGDCALNDDLRALFAAAREALVNSARWSGSLTVSFFVEVEPKQVSVFVRDRGKGFDPDSVGEGHRGIAESVRARMARHRGRAVIRSEIGDGTEVELVMPRPGEPV